MKAINLLFVLVALTFTACSSAESDNFEDNSSTFESMKSLYGIEAAAANQQTGDVPSVTTEEMGSVLEALHKSSAYSQDCNVQNTDGYYGTGSDKKTVMMAAQYQARTRSGQLVDDFALCVSLNFNVDKGVVYYINTTYSCGSSLFVWKGYSASLETKADGNHAFTSVTYLYFRVSDQNNCLVKVPVNFTGTFNFTANKGTYNFTLSKARN